MLQFGRRDTFLHESFEVYPKFSCLSSQPAKAEIVFRRSAVARMNPNLRHFFDPVSALR